MWDFHLMITGGKKKRAEDIHMHGNLFFVNTDYVLNSKENTFLDK